jgi:hypothetical protein
MGSCQSVAGVDGKNEPKQRGKPQMLIKTFTWSRDSHGLFDYESKTLVKKNMKTTHSGKLVRKGHEILLNKESDHVATSNEKELLRMHVSDGNFWVAPAGDPVNKKIGKDVGIEESEDNERSMWLVIKSFKPAGTNKPGFKLTEGDLIKLGRIKFRVKELKGSGAASTSKNSKSENLKSENLEKHTKIEEENVSLDSQRKNSKVSARDSRSSLMMACRICLGEQSESDDPFFSPCNCAGTMKFIHVTCLQRWLKSKLHVKQTAFSTSVYWKTLECELCKATFPTSFQVEGKKYDIVEIERPDCSYLMMEILSKEKNVLRGIHVIKMEGKSNIRLGRGHDSDVRITDISVSRCHALIRLDKGGFYIEDNMSKFGTLVHMRKPFALSGDYSDISLQLGRTVLSMSVKKNWRTFPGCFGGNQVKSPTEIDEDDIFGKSPPTVQSRHNEIIADLHRDQPNIDELNNVGQFEHHNIIGEGEMDPSPMNGEDLNLEDDQFSNMSGEENLDGEPQLNQNQNQVQIIQEAVIQIAENQAHREHQEVVNNIQQELVNNENNQAVETNHELERLPNHEVEQAN